MLYMRAPDEELFRDVRPGPVTPSSGAGDIASASLEPPEEHRGLSPHADLDGKPRPEDASEAEAKPKRRGRWVLVAVLLAAAIAGLVGYALTPRGNGDQDAPTSVTEYVVARVENVCEGRSNRMSGDEEMVDEAITTADVSGVRAHLANWHKYQQEFIDNLNALDLPDDAESAMGHEEAARISLEFAAEPSGDSAGILTNLISAQTELSRASGRWAELGISCTL